MKVLITSCGRLDLLKRTLRSLLHKQQYIFSGIVVHEDSPRLTKEQSDELNRMQHEFQFELVLLGGIGQHKSIEKFLSEYGGEYYLHVEDDWEFENDRDWIKESVEILETDEGVIKVLCRKDSPHPCEYNYCVGNSMLRTWAENGKENPVLSKKVVTIAVKKSDDRGHWTCDNFGYLYPWENNGITWSGFSWNPGVTRVEGLRYFMPFQKFEQEVAEDIYKGGLSVVALEQGVCAHIGEGRSTHE